MRHEKSCAVTAHEIVNGKPVVQNPAFADYDSLEDACKDYTWLITQGSPYHAAWERYQHDHDLHALIAAVAGKYSTSPQYAALVTTIASQNNVA